MIKDNIKTHVVIMAGGQGTRFWPMSRLKRPKQFLSISPNGENLIQATARRIRPISGRDNLWIVTNQLHKALIEECVPDVKILSEPVGRNTAASIALAAVYLSKIDPKGVMVVLAADHAVSDEKELVTTLTKATQLAANNDLLVTIGISPTFPHTGYGYIKRGQEIDKNSFKVSRFFEKPNLERATKYCESPDFYWNSGMFVWRVDVILNAFREYLPGLYEGIMKIGEFIGTSNEAAKLDEIFPTLESTSIDFGVLEHAKNCGVVVGQPFGWNDVGSWDAWAEHFNKDASGNLVHGEALVIDSSGCVVHSENRLTAILGGEDLVIIDTKDALLVCPRRSVQDVRKIVDELKKRGRNDLV